MNKLYERILLRFPQQFSFVFAYGSGVFAQKSKTPIENNVIDFIFVVDDPLSWHRENLKFNRKHYSFLKYGGVELIKKLQENYGAKIYFNTLIPIENVTIKYGVINTKHLIEDLLDWRTLYVSGRLHKPVLALKGPKNDELKRAINHNLQSALHASLLCLPEVFSPEELFIKITGLSYYGDFRMIVGEDKNKIQNIAIAQPDKFQELYESIIKDMPLVHWCPESKIFEQDCSPSATLHHLNLLPKQVQHNLLIAFNKDGHFRDIEEIIQVLAYDNDCSEMVLKAVSDIVWYTSITQSLKGIISAGALKSLKYSSKKLIKMIRSISL